MTTDPMRVRSSVRGPVLTSVALLAMVFAVNAPSALGDVERTEERIRVVLGLAASGSQPDLSTASARAQQQIERLREDIGPALEGRGVRVEHAADRHPYLVVSVPADQVDELEHLPGVAEVLPDPVLRPMLDSALSVVEANAVTGDDRILTGKGRAVAVLDTGVDTAHPFFFRTGGGHRVVVEACRAYDCPNGTDGAGSASPLKVGDGVDAHGTHVAGIVGGSSRHGSPHGGVAPEAELLAAQIFSASGSSVYTTVWHVYEGLDWVYQQRSAHDIVAVNLSLGSTSTYEGACDAHPDFSGSWGTAILDKVDQLRSAGILTVAAAGNGSSGERNAMSWPACLSNVVAVGATNNSDAIAGFSHLSHETDVVAPGVSIASAVPGGGYRSFSGTSMATPMVAGALALLVDAKPGSTVDERLTAITRSDTRLDDQRSGGVVTDLPRLAVPSNLGSVGVSAGGASAPGTPSVTSSNGELRASLSWSSVSAPNQGQVAYRLYRSTGSSCSSANSLRYEGTKTSYPDEGLTHGTTYRYCVYAVESSTNRSSRSNVHSLTAQDTTAPAAPSLSATAGDLSAELSWTKVSDPTGPVTYQLRRSTGSSCSPSSPKIYDGQSRSFTDTGLDVDRTYRYCVTATDGAGNVSDRSNVRSVVPNDPLDGCYAFSGDWNRSGRAGLGWWCDGEVKLRTSAGRTITYHYGRKGDVPIVADWNGDGRDTVSVIRDGTWHVNNRLGGGASERTFHYGRVTQGDVPIAGDWSRGGVDLPGIVRDREWHLRARQAGGVADWQFIYGRLTRGDLPLWGDWNGDGRDTVGIVRDGTWHLRNVHAGGSSDIAFVYGRVRSGDVPVVGDWTADGRATPGIVRDGEWHLRHRNAGGPADRVITFPRP